MGDLAKAMGQDTFTAVTPRGRELKLAILDVNDLMEIEEELGGSFLTLKIQGFSYATLVFIIWLGLRRAGITPEQVKKREWAIQRDDVGRLFIAGEYKWLGQTTIKLLNESGLDFRAVPEGEQAGGAQPPKTSGSPSSEAGLPSGSP